MIKQIFFTTAVASSIFFATLTSVVQATVPTPNLDDNGSASFVKQILPKLLGRKPRGTTEVNLLKDIANLHGREAVVRMLMEQDEFITHWRAILLDHMKLQRGVVLQGNRRQSSLCFEEAEGPTPYIGIGQLPDPPGGLAQQPPMPSDLAEFVRDSHYQSAFHDEFNMHDLIESALHLDNMFPAYRGYLYTLAAHPNSIQMRTRAQARAEVGAAFDDVFLNRNMECMSCHRGNYSTTGIGDRTHPLYHSLDDAVFDPSGGELPLIPSDLYQAECKNCHGENGTGGAYPVGVLDANAELITNAINQVPEMAKFGDNESDDDLSDGQIESLANALQSYGAFGQNFIGDTALKHNAVFRRDFFELDSPELGQGPWNMSTSCASISGAVSESIPAYFAGTTSDVATVADVDTRLHAGYVDLELALPYLPILDPGGDVTGNTALAYMLAAKITDNVWEQLFGTRLTIVNQYARNGWQKSMHKYLTESIFIANDWSLKELIVSMLSTRFFNRQAPAASLASGPYRLHPIFDPFVTADQECSYAYTSEDTHNQGGTAHGGVLVSQPDGDCAFNGQGELIHRYSPRTLLNAVSKAFDWPAPTIFPGSSYPSEVFSQRIGQYTTEFDPGDKEIGFQSLLEWDSQYSSCSPAFSGSDDDNDWIDKLITNIDAFNEKNPGAPLKLGELVMTLKDWIIQEPVFEGYQPSGGGLSPTDPGTTLFESTFTDNQEVIVEPVDLNDFTAKKKFTFSEQQLVQSFFGSSLDETISSEQVDASKVRELCGVYIKSPQFMLAGLIRNDLHDAPRYRVCNDGSCSYKDMCEAYKPTLSKLDYEMSCGTNSVFEPVTKKIMTRLTTGDSDNTTLEKPGTLQKFYQSLFKE